MGGQHKDERGLQASPALFHNCVGYILSAVFLSMALKNLPLSTTYAIWTGMGIAGTAILGIFLFSESASPLQYAFMAMIFIGIVGLELAG